jgi:hypothetical protein
MKAEKIISNSLFGGAASVNPGLLWLYNTIQASIDFPPLCNTASLETNSVMSDSRWNISVALPLSRMRIANRASAESLFSDLGQTSKRF